MRIPSLLPAALLVALVAAAGAQQVAKMPANQAAPGALPMQTQMIDLSLMEALAAVGAQDLAGVFAFIPEGSTAAAFADYLLHERAALKKFLKKDKRDMKDTGGVNAWDRLVAMYIIQVNGGPLPPGMDHLPKSLEYDVSSIVLAQPLSLEEMTARRGGRK